MPNQAKTHEDNRKTVCFLCMNKANRQLTDFMIKRSQEILGQRTNFEDQRVPIGICENCRVSLRRKDEGRDVQLPSLPDYQNIKIRPATRESACDCLICSVGKAKFRSPQISGTTNTASQLIEQPIVEKRCSACFSLIGRGIPHVCSKAILRQNLLEVAEKNKKAAERVAVSVIANKLPSPHGTVRLNQGVGRPFPVTPGKNCTF